MKKIKAIVRSLKNYARNGEHYRYHADVTNIITPVLAEKYKISLIYSPYITLFNDEKLVYKQNMKFDLTEEIESKDHIRDELFIYLKGIIEGNLHCPIEAKKAAAKKLDYAISPYKKANDLPYAENTSEIENALEELKSEKYAPSVTELGLDDAVTQLEAANLDFNTTYQARSGEKLQRSERVSMKTLRPQVDEAYVAVVNAINALYMANEIATKDETTREELGGIIDSVNALIVQLEETLSRRGGSPSTDDEEEPEPEPTPTPEPEPTTPEITKFYPKEGANPDRPLDFPRNKTAVLEGKGLKLVDSPEGKKAQLVLINYVDQRMPHEDSAILLNTDEKIEFTMMYDAAEGQYNFQIETYPNGTEEAVVIKYPETITLI